MRLVGVLIVMAMLQLTSAGGPLRDRLSQRSQCLDTCIYYKDAECDDGADGSQFSLCSEGTDCYDCEHFAGLPPKSERNDYN